MDFHFLAPLMNAYGITTLLCVFGIPALRRHKIGQHERGEGLESHQKKEGTPTMGGIFIILGIAATVIANAKGHPNILPVFLVTLGFGIVGFIDDFIKEMLHRSEGFKPWQKMLGQILVTLAFAIYIYNKEGVGTKMIVPFTGNEIDAGILFFPLFFFVVLGTVNGANFTDGIDGLHSTVTLVMAIYLSVVSIVRGEDLEYLSCAVIGALLSFLCFNSYKASVFMGDTGSLALGGFVVSAAYMMKMPLFVPIFAFVYLMEVLSVIIQVTYFKKTHGKRFFRMAPIHHHFEKGGWHETRVVAVFSVLTVLLCIIALWGLV